MNMLQMDFLEMRQPVCSVTERALRSAHALAGRVFSLVFTCVFTLPLGFPGLNSTLHYGECCCRRGLGACCGSLQLADPRNGEGRWSEKECAFVNLK